MFVFNVGDSLDWWMVLQGILFRSVLIILGQLCTIIWPSSRAKLGLFCGLIRVSFEVVYGALLAIGFEAPFGLLMQSL